jgi:O-antigen/teichoic acid export membrane protein
MFIGRLYGASFLGSIVLYLSILSMGLIVAKVGLFFSLEKKASEHKSEIGKLTSSTFFINLFFLTLTIIMMVLFRNQLGDYLGIDNFLFYLISSLIMGNFINFNYALIKAKTDFVIFSKLQLNRELIFRALAILFLLVDGSASITLVLLAKLIAEGMSFIMSFKYVIRYNIQLKAPEISYIKELLVLARYNSVLEIRALTFSWMDVWMIGFFLNEHFVGIYQIAWQISSTLLIVSKAVITVNFPHISKWASQNHYEKIESATNNALFLSLLIPIPAFIGSFLVAHDVLRIFGDEFVEGHLVLIILLSCSILRALQELLSKLLVGIGMAKVSYYSSIIAGLCNVMFNYFLIQKMGLEGAALATTVSTGINFIYCLYYLKRKTNMGFNWNKTLINLVASLLMLISIYIVDTLLHVTNSYILIAIGGAVWGIIIYYGQFKKGWRT